MKLKTIYVLSVLLILLRYTHEYKSYQEEGKQEEIAKHFIIQTKYEYSTASCDLISGYYRAKLNDCHTYRTGDSVVVFSNRLLSSDTISKKEIRLNNPKIQQVIHCEGSGKCTFYQILEKISQYTIEEKLVIKQLIAEPHASLLIGFLFGEKALLNESTQKVLKVVGMQHVISASGYNVALVLNFASLVFGKVFTKKITSFFSLTTMLVYIFMAGITASLLRAGLMVTMLVLSTHFFHKQYLAAHSLYLTAVILLLWQPFLIHSISFQLSFLATLGLVKFSHLFQPRTTNEPEKSYKLKKITLSIHIIEGIKETLKSSFQTTLAAQIFTLPIILFHFGELSLLSLVANTLLLWLTPLITILGLILFLVAPFSGVIAQFLAILAWLPIEVYLKCLDLFVPLSFTLIKIGGSWAKILSFAYVAGLFTVIIRRNYTSKPRKALKTTLYYV